MEVKVEGLQALQVKMKSTKKKISESGMKGLEAAGLAINEQAIRNIRNKDIWTTGNLANSARVERKGYQVQAGFFGSVDKGYAAAVEYGRGKSQRKGAIPLRKTMKNWVHKKLGIPYGKELDQVTFLVTRKIHRKGTQGKPFFTPAVEMYKSKIEKIIANEINKSI